jgi:uncharacterized protein YidB (DUF937 family)
MRLLDGVIDEWQAEAPENAAPLANALRDLLGGRRGTLEQLGAQFTRAGLGDVMRSWLGNETVPLAVEPGELRAVLGSERVGDLATVAGLREDEFLTALAHHLPGVVRRMTADDELS